MAFLSVLLILLGIVLVPVALTFRLAGDHPIIACTDRNNVKDMAGLNRWYGNRLLILPVVALGSGALGLVRPDLTLVGAGAFLLLAIVMFVWLPVGISSFQSVVRSPPRS